MENNCLRVVERDKTLLSRARECLKGNILSGKKCVWGDDKIVIPSHGPYLGAWNWDSAFHAIGLSHFDLPLAYRQIKLFLDTQLPNGMFCDALLANGKVFDRITKPPIMYFAFWNYFEKSGDREALEYAYPKFVKNEGFWTTYRQKNGLFFYSAFQDDDDRLRHCKLESGWDNSVRWDGGAENMWAIDLNCYMYMAYLSLEKMAYALNYANEASVWHEKAEQLCEKIISTMWNEEDGCFGDVEIADGSFSKVLSPASFMPLYIEIASQSQAAAMKRMAEDPALFYPLMPTVSYNDPEYSATDYWRGPTWLNTAYYAVKGLKNYGFVELANAYKERILEMCAKEESGIYEYYNSKTGRGLGAYQFGWSAVFIQEFILTF